MPEQTVTTSSVLFGDVVAAIDPERAKEEALGYVAYRFGAGEVIKREAKPPYQRTDE